MLRWTLSYTLTKGLDRKVLRLEPQTSPESVSTGETPLKKSQKELLLAMQECFLGRSR